MKYSNKPRKVNENADSLPRIKIDHFNGCINYQSKAKLSIQLTLRLNQEDNNDEQNKDNSIFEKRVTFVK